MITPTLLQNVSGTESVTIDDGRYEFSHRLSVLKLVIFEVIS